MASAKNEAKIIFKAETAEFTSAIKEANSEISSLGAEMRLAEATFKKTGDAVEYQKTKVKILEQQLSANADKQQALNQKLEAAKTIYGEDSEEVTKLERALINAKTQEQNLAAELKKANAELETQTKKAEPTAQALEKIAKNGEKLKTAGKEIKGVGEKLMPVTVALGGVGALGVKSFADVDKTMALTNKTMGNTKEQAELLNQAMKDAAANSTFGMKDAAEASLNFARANLNAEQAAAALGPAMNLAAGEGGKLDTVSAGLVGTINGFGDSFDNTSHYADVFAAACNNSSLDVDSLSNAMGVAAPVFRTAGKSVEDAALYMGVMANANIDANTSANALKTGLMRLADPAKGARDAMEKYGISADAVWGEDGSMKDSVEIQKNLHDSFQTLSEKEQLAAASAIFGKNQGAAWLALINTAPDEVERLSGSLEGCSGVTDEMAEAMMSGFGGSLEKLKSSIDVAVTSVGEALAPTIQSVANVIQSVVDKFNSLDASQKQTIATIGAVVAAIAPALVAIGTVLSTVGTIMTSLKTLRGVITALNTVLLANPMALVVIGIMALAAALIYAWNHSETFRNVVTTVFNAVRTVITTVVSTVANKVSSTWSAIQRITTTVWNAVRNAISRAITTAKNTVSTVVGTVKSKVSSVWNGIKSTTTSVWNGIRTAISNAITTAKNTVTNIINAIKTTVSSVFEAVKSTVSTTWENIKSTISDAITNAKETVSNMIEAIKGFFNLSDLVSKVQSTFNDIKEKMTKPITDAKEKISSIIDSIKGKFPFSLGHLIKFKLPKVTVTKGEFGIPHFKVSWNARGAVFRRPVIFGSGMYGLQGFGEAGPEVAAPLDTITGILEDAARRGNPEIDYDRLGTSVAKACARMNISIDVDKRTFGRVVREVT